MAAMFVARGQGLMAVSTPKYAAATA